ncbi:hypothetical protein PMAYCL1PPCAC_22232, partial [Pristionchus mayeri]
ASFFYRLFILKHESPSRRMMIVLLLIFSLLPLFMTACTSLSIDDESEVREAFKIIYDLDNYVVQGHIDSHPKLHYKISQLYTAGSAVPVAITVLFVRRKVIRTLDAQRQSMSERTVNVHKTLVKVLTLQACLPLIFSLTILCYVIEKFGIIYSPVIEHFIRVNISLMAAISPYIILNIRVFRDFIFCKRVRTKSTVSITTVISPSKSTNIN